MLVLGRERAVSVWILTLHEEAVLVVITKHVGVKIIPLIHHDACQRRRCDVLVRSHTTVPRVEYGVVERGHSLCCFRRHVHHLRHCLAASFNECLFDSVAVMHARLVEHQDQRIAVDGRALQVLVQGQCECTPLSFH